MDLMHTVFGSALIVVFVLGGVKVMLSNSLKGIEKKVDEMCATNTKDHDVFFARTSDQGERLSHVEKVQNACPDNPLNKSRRSTDRYPMGGA